ncbi:MAG: hypothetical protein ACMVY4_03895 [Minwuia sp.]|uniref:hypothetical protein n=1 Tax=Minwuia sp. TaxID=2493630 RepID=UPI003A857E5D
MTTDPEALLDDFETRRMHNCDFGHAAHVAVAWAMLNRHDFTDAVAHFGAGIRHLAAAGGAPEKYNATITVVFLSLIAERMQPGEDFEAFVAANPDLMTKDAVTRLYSAERLNSPEARSHFLMPDRVAV